jgi:hypothetical protein
MLHYVRIVQNVNILLRFECKAFLYFSRYTAVTVVISVHMHLLHLYGG